MAVLKNVAVLFCNLVKLDEMSGKYQVVVNLTEDQASDWEELGYTVKTSEYEGATQYKATFKTNKFPPIVAQDGRTIVDLQGSELRRGSIISIQYEPRRWTAKGSQDTGMATDIARIRLDQPLMDNEFEDLGSHELNSDI